MVRGGQGMEEPRRYGVGGREDAEKASKMCRSQILIASVRFPPFGFEIPEISSRDAQ